MRAPLTLHARSGDAAFLARLGRARFGGRVHSAFDKAVNVQCAASGDLYTVAAAGTDNGPNMLVVSGGSFLAAGIGVGDPVAGANEALVFAGKLTIALAAAAEWHARSTIVMTTGRRSAKTLAAAKAHVIRHGRPGGMLIDPAGSPVSHVISRMLASASDAMIDALARDDPATALEGAERLIGLGPGLTPSGDDFLVGLMAVIARVCPRQPAWAAVCARVATLSGHKTNAISHAAIRAAAAGTVRDRIQRLVDCLGEGDRVEQAIDQVLDIGSMSGTDIAWGVLRGLELHLITGEHAHGAESRH